MYRIWKYTITRNAFALPVSRPPEGKIRGTTSDYCRWS